jgi:hypothetical protein
MRKEWTAVAELRPRFAGLVGSTDVPSVDSSNL